MKGEPIKLILVTPIPLKYQKPTEIKECFIELFDNYLHFKLEFFADEPIIDEDVESGWESVLNSFEWTVIKKNIAGLEKSQTKDKKWKVLIIISGFSNDLKVYFKSHTAAQELFDKLDDWLLN